MFSFNRYVMIDLNTVRLNMIPKTDLCANTTHRNGLNFARKYILGCAFEFEVRFPIVSYGAGILPTYSSSASGVSQNLSSASLMQYT